MLKSRQAYEVGAAIILSIDATTRLTNTATDSLYEENKRLKKENALLKQERDILKKATAYFAKEIQ